MTSIKGFGTWFDYDRMVKPYIREHVLNGLFGDYTNEVKERFLDIEQYGVYRFKKAYNTQKKIEAFFIKSEYFIPPNSSHNLDLLSPMRSE